MIVYSQRLKFSIILGVLLISIFSVIWYSDNLNTKMEYIDKRIDFLDDLVDKAEGFNVKNLNDLSKRIVPRDEYDLLMEIIDNY